MTYLQRRPGAVGIYLWTALIVGLSPVVTLGQEVPPIDTFVEWKGFTPGDWKRVRVRRETFDDKGAVIQNSTAHTTTTLVALTEQGFTLRAEVNVEVAGRRFTPQPMEVWYGFHGETKGQTCSGKRIGVEPYEIGGDRWETTVCEITIRDGRRESITRVNYIDSFPHVLRRQTVWYDTSGEQPKELERATSEVLALDLPHVVKSSVRSVALVRTVVTRPEGRTVTVELHCEEVPGRVVAHWSTKWDAQGHIVERSTLELVDYFVAAEQDQAIPLRRPLLPRHRTMRPH